MLKFFSNAFTPTQTDEEHKSISSAIEQQLIQLKNDTDRTKMEMVITSSTGVWLDLWGSWFGVPRLTDENDYDYGRRIIATTFKQKGTIPALIETVRLYEDDDELDVTVYEPYTDLFKMNMTTWGSRHRYPDAIYYSRGVVDIETPNPVTTNLRELIDEVRAAGIKVFYTSKNIIDADGYPIESHSKTQPSSDYSLLIKLSTNRAEDNKNEISIDRVMSGGQILWGTHLNKEVQLQTKLHPGIQDGEAVVQSPVDMYTMGTGIFTLSSKAWMSKRSPISGFRLTKFDLENPVEYKDTGIDIDSDVYVPYTEIREVYSNSVRTIKSKTETSEGYSGSDSNSITSGERITNSHFNVSTEMYTISSKEVTAESEIPLEEIWLSTLRQVANMGDISQLSAETQTIHLGIATISSKAKMSKKYPVSGFRVTQFDLDNPIPFEDEGIEKQSDILVSYTETRHVDSDFTRTIHGMTETSEGYSGSDSQVVSSGERITNSHFKVDTELQAEVENITVGEKGVDTQSNIYVPYTDRKDVETGSTRVVRNRAEVSQETVEGSHFKVSTKLQTEKEGIELGDKNVVTQSNIYVPNSNVKEVSTGSTRTIQNETEVTEESVDGSTIGTETQLYTININVTSAASGMILKDIWLSTVQEISGKEDKSQLPIQITTKK